MLETHECDVRKVAEGLTEEEAYNQEILTIAKYRESANYRLTNVLDGGDNPPKLFGEDSPTKRPEVRFKMSQTNTAKWSNADHRERMQKSFKSFYQTDRGHTMASDRTKANWQNQAFRDKIVSAMSATTHTDSYKSAKSETMKKAYASQEVRDKVTGSNNGASRKVSQYDKNNNLIAVYDTLMDAERQTGLSVKNISKALRGHHKTAYGFIWKHADSKKIIYKERKPYDNPTRIKKAVLQYDLSNNFIKEYESVASAAYEFPNHTNIISNLKGKTKSAYGFIWKYKESQ